jgi:hypothetical protein
MIGVERIVKARSGISVNRQMLDVPARIVVSLLNLAIGFVVGPIAVGRARTAAYQEQKRNQSPCSHGFFSRSVVAPAGQGPMKTPSYSPIISGSREVIVKLPRGVNKC